MAVLATFGLPGVGQLYITVVEESDAGLVPSLGRIEVQAPGLEASDCLAFFAEVMMQWLEHFDRELMGPDVPNLSGVSELHGDFAYDEEEVQEAFDEEEPAPDRPQVPQAVLEAARAQAAVESSNAAPADEGTVTSAIPSQED